MLRSCVRLCVALCLCLCASDAFAQTINENLKIRVDYKNLYQHYQKRWPSTVEAGLAFLGNFYETTGGPPNTAPFKNKNGFIFVADQDQLTNLTITSVVDLMNNHPAEYAKYTPVPFSTDANANWSSTFPQPDELAVFFALPVDSGSGNVWWVTEIFYYETVDYSAQPVNWTVGPGWDGETPFVFVHVVRRFVEIDGGPGGGGILLGSEVWGLDVVEATTPRNESSLQILLPDAQQTGGFSVEQLFPLPAHLSKIDGPIGSGAVVEPNLSLDGKWVIFSYFHDVKSFLTDPSNGSMPLKGADLYMIDLAPILADPSVDPATLTCHRLTSTLWNQSTGEQLLSDKNSKAMNPDLAQNHFAFDFRYGRLFMHGIETKMNGKKRLVFASNLRRLGNSNNAMDKGNYNLNLFEGKLNFANGTLSEINQIHYYTTTSAMSPANLRDGFTFAYQSTTEEARSWEVQVTKSNYQWSPGVGYGINGQTVLHLQTLAPATTQDWLVTAYYYNQNNNGFGTLVANPANDLGKNVEVQDPSDYFFGSYYAKLPRQSGIRNMVIEANASDDPLYHGKVSAPRAGRENEIFASYSPHTSNDKEYDSGGNMSWYDSYLVSFPNVDAKLEGGSSWHVSELELVLDDQAKWTSQVWGVPVLSHEERFGEPVQSTPKVEAIDEVPYYQNNPTAIHGKPYAVIGTSALSNTDILTKDARFAAAGSSYDLAGLDGNEEIHVQNNIAGLSKVLTDLQGVPNFFARPRHEHLLGVAVHLTSNKPDASYSMDYATASGTQEITRLVGVYDVRNTTDDSFLATIPSNQSIELQLLDREFGLKLADQRSWKSLKSGELRNDCGGCHNHVGAPVPFQGTHADGANYVPEDMIDWTRYVDYDAFCAPQVLLSPEPALEMPEYYADILPGLQTYCGSCHSGGNPGASAFSLDNSENAYAAFVNRNYYNNDGALGSPLFWAARGMRTDNRNNALYSSSDWKYSPVHDGLGLCDGGSLAEARWVYQLGLWIDHLMPRKLGTGPQPFDPKFDRYHPSVNFDLKLINNDPDQKDPTKLVVGWWDDSDFSPAGTLKVFANGVLKHTQAVTANGSAILNIASWNVQNSHLIEAVIIDGVDNHQYYTKPFRDILPPLQPAEPIPGGPIGGGTPGG